MLMNLEVIGLYVITIGWLYQLFMVTIASNGRIQPLFIWINAVGSLLIAGNIAEKGFVLPDALYFISAFIAILVWVALRRKF